MKRISGMLVAVLGKDTDEEDLMASYSAEEVGTRRSRRRGKHEEGHQPREFSVESAAEIVDDLPSDVRPEIAARIVQGALAAVGIEVSNLERVTRERESKLISEIGLARNRQEEFQEQTQEAVRSLEEKIKKVREEMSKVQEACDAVLAEEEKRVSRAVAALKEVRRVRAFFNFRKTDTEENITPIAQDEKPLGVGSRQVERPSGPRAGTDSRVLMELPSRTTASYDILPAIEVDQFDEFVARIRGEEERAQETPQPIDERSRVTARPAEGAAFQPLATGREPSGDRLGKERRRQHIKEEIRSEEVSSTRAAEGPQRMEETPLQGRKGTDDQIWKERKIGG